MNTFISTAEPLDTPSGVAVRDALECFSFPDFAQKLLPE
jgi:hypothetical protein